MRPRPIVVVWLLGLTAVAFFVAGFIGYFGRRVDGGAFDVVGGAIFLLGAVLLSRMYRQR
jgi:hypothetical protein